MSFPRSICRKNERKPALASFARQLRPSSVCNNVIPEKYLIHTLPARAVVVHFEQIKVIRNTFCVVFLHTRWWNNVIPEKYLQEERREAGIGIIRPTVEAVFCLQRRKWWR